MPSSKRRSTRQNSVVCRPLNLSQSFRSSSMNSTFYKASLKLNNRELAKELEAAKLDKSKVVDMYRSLVTIHHEKLQNMQSLLFSCITTYHESLNLLNDAYDICVTKDLVIPLNINNPLKEFRKKKKLHLLTTTIANEEDDEYEDIDEDIIVEENNQESTLLINDNILHNADELNTKLKIRKSCKSVSIVTPQEEQMNLIKNCKDARVSINKVGEIDTVDKNDVNLHLEKQVSKNSSEKLNIENMALKTNALLIKKNSIIPQYNKRKSLDISRNKIMDHDVNSEKLNEVCKNENIIEKEKLKKINSVQTNKTKCFTDKKDSRNTNSKSEKPQKAGNYVNEQKVNKIIQNDSDLKTKVSFSELQTTLKKSDNLKNNKFKSPVAPRHVKRKKEVFLTNNLSVKKPSISDSNKCIKDTSMKIVNTLQISKNEKQIEKIDLKSKIGPEIYEKEEKLFARKDKIPRTPIKTDLTNENASAPASSIATIPEHLFCKDLIKESIQIDNNISNNNSINEEHDFPLEDSSFGILDMDVINSFLNSDEDIDKLINQDIQQPIIEIKDNIEIKQDNVIKNKTSDISDVNLLKQNITLMQSDSNKNNTTTNDHKNDLTIKPMHVIRNEPTTILENKMAAINISNGTFRSVTDEESYVSFSNIQRATKRYNAPERDLNWLTVCGFEGKPAKSTTAKLTKLSSGNNIDNEYVNTRLVSFGNLDIDSNFVKNSSDKINNLNNIEKNCFIQKDSDKSLIQNNNKRDNSKISENKKSQNKKRSQKSSEKEVYTQEKLANVLKNTDTVEGTSDKGYNIKPESTKDLVSNFEENKENRNLLLDDNLITKHTSKIKDNIEINSADELNTDKISMDEIDRPRRRAQTINYKEPSLVKKMRRPKE